MLLKYVVANSQIDFLSILSWLGFSNLSAPELSFWLRIYDFECDEVVERRKEIYYWKATALALDVELCPGHRVQFYPKLIQPIVHDISLFPWSYRVTCPTIWAFLFTVYR